MRYTVAYVLFQIDFSINCNLMKSNSKKYFMVNVQNKFIFFVSIMLHRLYINSYRDSTSHNIYVFVKFNVTKPMNAIFNGIL